LKDKNTQLRNELTKLEAYTRRENLKFDGIREKTDENCEQTLYKLFSKQMQIPDASSRIKISRCHRIGRFKENADKARTIVAKFHFYPDRMEVWQNRKLLKGTGIFVNEDFPIEIDRQRRTMMPIMKAARDQGMKAYLVGSKLMVDSRAYTMTSLDSLPEAISTTNVSEKRLGDYVFFSGRLSPLSNFHPCILEDGGITFNTSEQYYQYHKAMFAKDYITAKKILLADDPIDQKSLGDGVKLDIKAFLQGPAKSVMRNGLRAKFSQNNHLKDKLKATYPKQIVECNKFDKFWGIGLPLHDENLMYIPKWQGNNWLGEILTEVRDVL
jgi:ribA/ribD-fused uncharacterized protein